MVQPSRLAASCKSCSWFSTLWPRSLDIEGGASVGCCHDASISRIGQPSIVMIEDQGLGARGIELLDNLWISAIVLTQF